MNKIIIAIDGYAATGKSTIAKRIAKKLNYIYIDTGAMYRAVSYFGLQQSPEGKINFTKLIASLPEIKIHFENSEKGLQTFINGENRSLQIRESRVNEVVSVVASVREIREFLVEQQRIMGNEKGIVMDGRDIGTVVFPEAECKFFLTAAPEIRAQRRHKEQLEAGNNESFEAVLANVKSRDHQDSTRVTSPLTKASDAIEVEVSHLTIEEVLQKLQYHIDKKLG